MKNKDLMDLLSKHSEDYEILFWDDYDGIKEYSLGLDDPILSSKRKELNLRIIRFWRVSDNERRS